MQRHEVLSTARFRVKRSQEMARTLRSQQSIRSVQRFESEQRTRIELQGKDAQVSTISTGLDYNVQALPVQILKNGDSGKSIESGSSNESKA